MEMRSADVLGRGAARVTRADLQRQEAAEDHEALLTEPWSKYASRKGCTPTPERVKWTTETWAEFERRKAVQGSFLERQNVHSQREAAQQAEQEASETRRSAAVVERLVAAENARKGALLRCRHFLCVDYSEYQQYLFSNQRSFLAQEEDLLRCKIVEGEDDLMQGLAMRWHLSCLLQEANEIERAEKEAAAERLRESEQQQRLMEEKQLEAQRAAQEREAALAEKEQAEMEKRLERKRRDEERRAKARADREQRKAHE